MSRVVTIKPTTKRCMLTDKFIPLQTSKRTGWATAVKRILSISARTKGRQNSSADGGPEGNLQFEEGIEKTVRWYLDNQEWLDNVTSGDYQKYYDNMYNK